MRKWEIAFPFGNIQVTKSVSGTSMTITDIGIVRVFNGSDLVFAAGPRSWAYIQEIPQ